MNHLGMGGWLLLLAFLTSVAGSTVGLACTLQARYATHRRAQISWLVLAAVSIGGVGIWLMHFVAMLGFETPGFPVRYDIPRTLLSAVLSVSAVFLGLLVVRGRNAVWRLALGGIITGLAVNLMHWTGMWALRIKGHLTYDMQLVGLSVLIAVVAATAALWFTTAIDKSAYRMVAGVVMGIAVTGMHYTGMAAIHAHLDPAAPDPAGVEVFTFLFPVFVLGATALAIAIYAALMAESHLEKSVPT